jgi:phosphatidylserine/phosphatidylglycerophosphate/cardiolipin synthase-like enzyme
MSKFSQVTEQSIETLVIALKDGRLSHPVNKIQLDNLLGNHVSNTIADELGKLLDLTGLKGAAHSLEVLLADRRQRPIDLNQVLNLVWTGPEIPGIRNRDTKVVVGDLFRKATKSVIVSGYSFYRGNEIFQALADKLKDDPNFSVKIFMNLSQDHTIQGSEDSLASRRRDEFFRYNWPWQKKPEIYYDPRAVNSDNSEKAVLHAKCIVKDSAELYIGSANFSEAAHSRNIEAGVLIKSIDLAKKLERHFLSLVEAGLVKPL